MLRPLQSWDLTGTQATFTNGQFHGIFQGVELQKCADDLDRYADLISASRPDLVVEMGTRTGGSALWFRREMGLEVVTIDRGPSFTKGRPPQEGPGIAWVRGSSIDPAIVSMVLPLLSGKRVMLSLDSDHHAPHVLAEMAVWAAAVSPGCYMVVEDGCFDAFQDAGRPDWAVVGGSEIPTAGGPLHALRMSKIEESPVFERDERLEGLTPISHSPCGWWRKHE